MERFKACEKEMKTKAYSKEGLTNSARLDPREKEKAESAAFISSMLEELERQVEGLEAEQETIQATTKKGRKDPAKQERMSEIEETLERHRWHQDKLEIILRMLENGTISPDSVNSVQDDIQYYVESNQDAEFAEDEEIYAELNLDEDEDGESYIQEDTPSYSLEDLASEISGSYSTPAAAPIVTTQATHKHEHPPAHKPPAPSVSSQPTNGPNQTTVPVASSFIGGMKPAPPPVRSTNELKYASAAAAAGSSAPVPQGLSPLPPPSGSQSSTAGAPLSDDITTSTAPVTTPEMSENTTPKEAAVEPVHHKAQPPKEDSSFSTKPRAADPPISADSIPSETVKTSLSSRSKLPPGLQDLISSFDAAKSRIGSPPPISSISKLLESSYLNCPDSFIANKPRYYQPETPFPSPSYYPQEPLTTLNEASIVAKMDNDTLFYIFYYRQGTYLQSLAAKELKNRSWRFHKRFLTWFQRHEEPKVINNDFEQGTYRYFDFEGLWLQRRKSNFKFEYQFLEDEV